MKSNYETREAWLVRMAQRFIAPHFKRHGLKLPKVHISVGVPFKRNPYKVVGQCFDASSSADKAPHVFISPTNDCPYAVTETLMHELIHAVIGNKAGHGAEFKEAALKVGFLPPMRSTPASDDLKHVIKGWVKQLGKFPHAKLSFAGRKKQSTRLIKMECEKDGYIVRAAKTPVLENGPVICPVCKVEMSYELPEGDE